MVTNWLRRVSKERPGTAAGGGRFLGVLSCTPENVLKMRTLAAQMRGHAAETTIALYRRKFEEVASELEESAVDAESRATRFRLVS